MAEKQKHILITEQEWDSHYKRLDEIIDDLKNELSKKDVQVYMARYFGDARGTILQKIGEIHTDITGGQTLKEFDKQRFFNLVEDAAGVTLIDTEDARSREWRIQQEVEKIKQLPRFIRWWFNISHKV